MLPFLSPLSHQFVETRKTHHNTSLQHNNEQGKNGSKPSYHGRQVTNGNNEKHYSSSSGQRLPPGFIILQAIFIVSLPLDLFSSSDAQHKLTVAHMAMKRLKNSVNDRPGCCRLHSLPSPQSVRDQAHAAKVFIQCPLLPPPPSTPLLPMLPWVKFAKNSEVEAAAAATGHCHQGKLETPSSPAWKNDCPWSSAPTSVGVGGGAKRVNEITDVGKLDC